MQVIEYEKVEGYVRDLQREIWDHQASLWPGETLSPLEMFTPETAARVLGVNLEYGNIVQFGSRNARYALGGIIDRQRNLIALSDHLTDPAIIRFTGGHEVGHWNMHKGMVMHRDIPVRGMADPRERRPIEEVQADYYSACYLVPKKILLKAFRARFGTAILKLNETTAFWLAGNDADDLVCSPIDSLDFERAVASSTRFDGRQFESLTSVFRVSNTTMAIRLKELGFATRY